ncbi:MAG TPA: hypothetical protein VEH04_17085 [Verrucomicrobiae bacterium]|nr:hypothetical protein [Verrucomicrobiae bacterium]
MHRQPTRHDRRSNRDGALTHAAGDLDYVARVGAEPVGVAQAAFTCASREHALALVTDFELLRVRYELGTASTALCQKGLLELGIH